MATSTIIEEPALPVPGVLVRIAAPERDALWRLLFSRYPNDEWGSFVRFGWRETRRGLVLTLTALDPPALGDLEERTEITEFQAQYSRRIVRLTEEHPFAVGVVHSHPEHYSTHPSPSDYDMEAYYAELLRGYTPDRPFVSVIFSVSNGITSGSGRVWWRGQWLEVSRFAIEGCPVALYDFQLPSFLTKDALTRVQRLASAFSIEAAEALSGATVAVIGASGTGSPVLELLGRAGVGHLIPVDPDIFGASNLERVHGSTLADIDAELPKVLIAQRHIGSINPDCVVTPIKGRLPQAEVIDELLWADLIVGCVDSHSGRVALSDLSLRFLVPVIDVGVVMEGKNGVVTGQALQINRLFPADPCVYCRGMISSQLVAQELMSEEEQTLRQASAAEAVQRGEKANPYWQSTPQLNTVGYLTTMAGSMTTGFSIGYLTGRFQMPKNRLELSLNNRGSGIVERDAIRHIACTCGTARGIADQQPLSIMISAPTHWPSAVIYEVGSLVTPIS